MPRNIAVRGLVGHTLIHKSELGVIVDKSLLAGQDKTFAALFLRVSNGFLNQLTCIPISSENIHTLPLMFHHPPCQLFWVARGGAQNIHQRFHDQ